MHTSRQLKVEDYAVEVDGVPATREDVLPGWTPWDRLGIVVDRPFGALGATGMIQLAITAFYDVRPERRAGFPSADDPLSERAIYPEIYLFHVGGRHGFHSAYDFWPARKEVFVPAEPRLVLDAVNDRGVTRLLVPDEPPRAVVHEHKEPASARDRISTACLYSPTGRVAHPDVTLSASRGATQANARQVLSGPAQRGNLMARADVAADGPEDPELARRSWHEHLRHRADEASAHVDAARVARERLLVDGSVVETYRRTTVDDALARLTGRSGAAPA